MSTLATSLLTNCHGQLSGGQVLSTTSSRAISYAIVVAHSKQSFEWVGVVYRILYNGLAGYSQSKRMSTLLDVSQSNMSYLTRCFALVTPRLQEEQ